ALLKSVMIKLNRVAKDTPKEKLPEIDLGL
ncbi:MAG: hypothetical protein UW03_C0031G0001, partial [Candidatus Peregrinibacteria bacterium GW2011_GWA2_43_8]